MGLLNFPISCGNNDFPKAVCVNRPNNRLCLSDLRQRQMDAKKALQANWADLHPWEPTHNRLIHISQRVDKILVEIQNVSHFTIKVKIEERENIWITTVKAWVVLVQTIGQTGTLWKKGGFWRFCKWQQQDDWMFLVTRSPLENLKSPIRKHYCIGCWKYVIMLIKYGAVEKMENR